MWEKSRKGQMSAWVVSPRRSAWKWWWPLGSLKGWAGVHWVCEAGHSEARSLVAFRLCCESQGHDPVWHPARASGLSVLSSPEMIQGDCLSYCDCTQCWNFYLGASYSVGSPTFTAQARFNCFFLDFLCICKYFNNPYNILIITFTKTQVWA